MDLSFSKTDLLQVVCGLVLGLGKGRGCGTLLSWAWPGLVVPGNSSPGSYPPCGQLHLGRWLGATLLPEGAFIGDEATPVPTAVPD